VIKFFLWAVILGGGWCAESLTLMWVASAIHDWWALVPLMDFGQAFSVSVALSAVITVWVFADKLIDAVNEL